MIKLALLPGECQQAICHPEEISVPIYEYECRNPKCGHQFEMMQKMSDNPIRTCPVCKARKVAKLISASSFVLKGGGWYQTEIANKEKAAKAANNAKTAKLKEGASSSGASESSTPAAPPAAPAATPAVTAPAAAAAPAVSKKVKTAV